METGRTARTITRIVFEHDREVEEQNLGRSLLEISLEHGIPHVHACGGNARCSTCRVLVVEGLNNIAPRNEAEQKLARRKGLEPDIRLACQTRLSGDVRVRRLVIDQSDVEVALTEGERTSGAERPVAVLFSDVRGFTTFSEAMLPYDVVHVLNRYFLKTGEAVLQNGGRIDKYMGDGMMAVFGADGGEPHRVAGDAVRAGLEIFERLDEFNQYLAKHFDKSFRIGVGIHYGEAILGEKGHPRHMQFSALGDTVNLASRIESTCKRVRVNFLISEPVRHLVRDEFQFGRVFTTEITGKSGRYRLYEVLGKRLADADSETHSDEDAQERRRWMMRLARTELRRCVTRDVAPQYLRLVFHDACTYDVASGSGGPTGSVRYEVDRAEDAFLKPCIDAITAAQECLAGQGVDLSWADLLVIAGAVAIEVCDGPAVEVHPGRRDAAAAEPVGFVPDEHDGEAKLVERFRRMGLDMRDLVLLSGAHTLGLAHGVPFTEDPFTFDNGFLRRLLDDADDPALGLLETDRLLVKHPAMRRMVEEYARDEQRFFRDFAAAYRKLTRDYELSSASA